MKKISLFLILITLIIYPSKKIKALDYYARSYIVMDYNTSKILEGKDYNLVRSVASISKIMTAIVAIENTFLDSYAKVNEDILKAYGSSIYLKVDEIVIMEDLLYGLMLRSGNDAAVTIANAVGGNISAFVELMNKKAKEIGMKNTLFNNPSGLDIDDDGNLSTSYDMALLMQYAMKNEIFRKITSTKEYKSRNHGVWTNKNKLLRQYDNTSGGKTGFTTKARRTLVTSAKKDDMELIVVTLDCGGDFSVHKGLYEKYFNNYKTFKLLKEGSNLFEEYELICDTSISVTIENNKITNHSVVYNIRNNEADVLLINNDEESNIGKCNVTKNNKKEKKKSLFRKVFNKYFFKTTQKTTQI